jgi:hypothetical protein
MFNIIDGQTGAVIGSTSSRKGAERTCDKRNAAYGSHRFYAVKVAS